MACFAVINVSQGSVATYAKCGAIFNIHSSANLPVKNFLKSVKIRQNYGHESVAPIFWPTMYMVQFVLFLSIYFTVYYRFLSR